MSLSFGEIVEPSTRAFWDDYDEGDEELTTLPDLAWEWLNEDSKAQPPASVKRLLIFEGQGISAFVGTAILKGRAPICRLNHGAVSIYYHEERAQLVCLSEEKELNGFSRITEKLGEWLECAEQVIAFSFQPSVMHKGTPAGDAEEVCFVRALNGSAGVPELETPNVITGLSAGALSYRKFKGLGAASAYVFYLDSSVVDSATAKPILRLLKSLAVECDDQYQLKFLAGSNLYM